MADLSWQGGGGKEPASPGPAIMRGSTVVLHVNPGEKPGTQMLVSVLGIRKLGLRKGLRSGERVRGMNLAGCDPAEEQAGPGCDPESAFSFYTMSPAPLEEGVS